MRSWILAISFIIVFLTGAIEVKAADLQAKLDSNDGSSGFSIQDSGSIEITRVDSDGNLTCTKVNGLTPTAQATGFTLAGGTSSKTLTVTGDATISATPLVDPMTTRGDVMYCNSSNATARLPVGAANAVLGTDGTDVAWVASTGTGNNVRATSPTLVTPTLGAATCTTINGLTPTELATGFTIEGGSSNSRTLTVTGNATISGTPLSDPMTTRGDVIVRDSSNTTARLAVGASGTCLASDGTDAHWDVPNLTNSNSKLGADVSITANTWANGPSVSLAAGTWLVIAQITLLRSTSTATTYSARISTGSTHYASSGHYMASTANHIQTLTMATTITLASTTTIYVQATANQTATIKAALVTNGAGNNATQITAVRLL